ncbi:MAG: hypothetical protein IKJ32_00750 [Clostridia bacterium]|nr:hypothetical protein [Clostridia bacterium]
MIEGFCRLISWVCGLFPDSVWIAVILVFGIAWLASGQTLGSFIWVGVLALVAYGLLWLFALLIPLWLENLIVIALVILIIWAKA